MEVRSYNLDVREMGDTGTFTGYASVFGNVDSYGTIFDAGAFKKTINDNQGRFPITWFHDPMAPIGIAQVEEDKKGLLVNGELDLDTDYGRRVYSGLKKGYIDRMSHGFSVVTEAKKDNVPHIKEVKLFEVALITRNFASNEEALVNDVRAASAGLRRVGEAIRSGATLELQNALADLRSILDGLEERKATPFADLPLADKASPWDAGKARARVKDWADGDMTKYRRAFLWYDETAPDNLTSYKFPIGDIIDGQLKAVPRAIYAAAARVGGSDIDDKDGVKKSIERYYKKLGEEAPWNRGMDDLQALLAELRPDHHLASNEPPLRPEPQMHSDLLSELREFATTLSR